MLVLLMMIASVVIPPAVLLAVARHTVYVTTSFLAADRSRPLTRLTVVAAYTIGVGFMLVGGMAVALMQPAQDASVSLPPSYLLWPAIILRTMMLALTWCFALIAMGMGAVMAMNYMRVPSGRRPGAALLVAGMGSICLALAQTVAMQGTSVPVNIMHVVGAGLHASAWALRRPGN